MKKLAEIQSRLKAPKGQFNKFGNYKYRSCEDILEALKPIMSEVGCSLTLTDDMVMVGDRIYVKATATLYDEDGKTIATTTAFAREEETKKGMDGSQITGASSSYARKYALNGMFCIDDAKDSDATNDHSKSNPSNNQSEQDEEYYLGCAKQEIAGAKSKEELMRIYNAYTMLHTNKEFMGSLTAKKKNL